MKLVSKGKVKIGVLTSSRADYGIYLPLLKRLNEDPDFDLKLIVFGTHLSPFHGMTINAILQDGFEVNFKINSLLLNDDPNSIATSASLTMLKFGEFWSSFSNEFDLVFCLGDRYEMFSAVYAGIPLGVKFAHIHGGETSSGAIDNVFRHAISLASTLHFTSTEVYKEKVFDLTCSENIYVSGALSLDNLDNLELYDIKSMKSNFGIDFGVPTILITVHPETVSFHKNDLFADECHNAFRQLARDYQLVITMPNADTMGSRFRNAFVQLKKECPEKVQLVENFGTRGYFSAMRLSKLLIGNTSSGIIEAATFGKFVLNLGDRQRGRLSGINVINLPFKSTEIVDCVSRALAEGDYTGPNLYFAGGASDTIVNTIKDYVKQSIN